tara:strand:+ start:432 stop:1253 length:822 start_codon:yes stop_codon:yes gene_type:complete
MPNLLDLVLKKYEHGGYHADNSIDFDPFAYTTQADTLGDLGIEIRSDDALAEISTFDPMAQNLAIEGYNLRQEGFKQANETAQRQGAQSLQDLATPSTSAGSSGFGGTGDSLSQMTNIRKSLTRDFADTQREIGLRKDQSYLDLQQDVYNINQAYQDTLAQDVAQLDESDYGYTGYGSSYTPEAGGEPTSSGSFAGEIATGADGNNYEWRNGAWAYISGSGGGEAGNTDYANIPNTYSGNNITVGGIPYYWNANSQSYVQGEEDTPGEDQDKI